MTNATARPTRPTRPAHDSEETSLEELLAETGLDWVPEGTGFTARLSACRIVAERQGERMVLSVELACLKSPSPESLSAIADFIGAINSRMRCARASLFGNRVLLEAAIPGAALAAAEITKAVGALSVGISIAKKECAALLDQGVARYYLDFHNKGERSI